MTIFGIDLRKPSFDEITAATIMGVGLWIAAIGIAHFSGHPLAESDAGALLLVSVWACIGARLGVGFGKGRRELVAHVGVSAALLALYQGALILAA